MKEWLLKTEDGKYHYYRDDMDCCPKHVEKIEIPEGAELFAFWPYNNDYNFHVEKSYFEDGKWNMCAWSVSQIRNCEAGAELLWDRKVRKIKDDSIFTDESEIVNEEMKSLDDKVNQPSHYANFSIECIDAMQAMLSREEFIGYLRGNIFKYLWRYKLKNGVECLKKAQWYQNKLIEVEENE